MGDTRDKAASALFVVIDKVNDQGAHFLSAIASVIDSTDPAEIQSIIEAIPDPVGTFYRYSLADSLLRRARIK